MCEGYVILDSYAISFESKTSSAVQILWVRVSVSVRVKVEDISEGLGLGSGLGFGFGASFRGLG